MERHYKELHRDEAKQILRELSVQNMTTEERSDFLMEYWGSSVKVGGLEF